MRSAVCSGGAVCGSACTERACDTAGAASTSCNPENKYTGGLIGTAISQKAGITAVMGINL